MLDYPYFKLIAIDLSKQELLDAGPKAMQQIIFTRNLNRDGNTQTFLIIEEATKKNSLRFFKGNRGSILILFCLNIILI